MLAPAPIPRSRLGTPFQRPGWRYDAVCRPEVYGLGRCCSRRQDHSAGLRRLAFRGLQIRSNDLRSPSLDRLAARLPEALAGRLRDIWRRRKRRLTRRTARVLVPDLARYRNLVPWNAARIAEINDEWMVRLVRHQAGLESDPAIVRALRLYLEPEHVQLRRFIGMMIFSGATDAAVAKDWQLPVRVITAMRMLFYDFGALPRAKVPRWAMMVQLLNNGDIDKDDFQLYRRVEDLGPLGLKAQVAGASLDEQEQQVLREHLGRSAVTNAFDIQFGVRNTKDAVTFGRALSDLGRVEQLKADTVLSRTQERKLAKDLQSDTSAGLAAEDEALLRASLDSMSKENGNPRYRSLAELVEPPPK